MVSYRVEALLGVEIEGHGQQGTHRLKIVGHFPARQQAEIRFVSKVKVVL